MELTPQETNRDLQNLLINILPNFEFPKKNLYDYTIGTKIVNRLELTQEDFVLYEVKEGAVVDTASFGEELSLEEINILSILMMDAWLQRQITSIENIRMKYSGSDFKFTSQANHLAKLLTLQTEIHRQSHHMQRLYKRRKFADDGKYASNWSILRESNPLDD